MAVVGIAWFGSPLLGAVIAVAMVTNLIVAGLAGVGIPVVLDRLGIDPALADPAMLDKLFERMQAPPAATRAPARPLACAFLHSCCYRARCRPHRRLSPA